MPLDELLTLRHKVSEQLAQKNSDQAKKIKDMSHVISSLNHEVGILKEQNAQTEVQGKQSMRDQDSQIEILSAQLAQAMEMAEKLALKNKELVTANQSLASQLERSKDEATSMQEEHLKEIENLKLEHSQEIYMLKRMR